MHRHRSRIVGLLIFLVFSSTALGSGPTPISPQVPGVVVDRLRASSSCYVGSPSIAVLPDGSYVASHDIFGPGSTSDRTVVFASRDHGITWTRQTEIVGQWWSTLFVVNRDLYLMGVSRSFGHVVIRRSTDAGKTWTTPTNSYSGLLIDNGKFHCAPGAVVEHNGRVFRAIEDANSKGGRADFHPFVMSAPENANLLVAANWKRSDSVAPGHFLNGEFQGWLEGNAVVTPDGHIADILRVNRKSKGETAAIVHLDDDLHTVRFDPQSDFVSFPGGNSKFTIRRDPQSKLYWTLSNYIPPEEKSSDPNATRNTLALVNSPDLIHWTVQCILLYYPDRSHHAFQYVDWQFDGDDIIAVSRTAYDDDTGGANTYHNANFLTFHRFKNFRSLTMKDSAPTTFVTIEETPDFTIIGTHFQHAPLADGAKAFSNRDYTWQNIPPQFQGGWFTQTPGGEPATITVQAKHEVTVYAATASSQAKMDLSGWDRMQDLSFMYSDHSHTQMDIYQKHLAAGEKVELPQGNWSGMILLVPPGK